MDLQGAFEREPVYFILAGIGTSLFLLKTLLLLVGGDAADADIDIDFDAGDIDSGHIDGGAAFTLFSTQSVFAFLMGSGWMGLAAREEWGLERFPATLAAGAFGFAMMLLSSFLTHYMRRLDHQIPFDMKSCIGTTGRAYVTIPSRGNGQGQAEVTVSGRRQVLAAVSNNEEIASFENVKVVDVIDDSILVVEKGFIN